MKCLELELRDANGKSIRIGGFGRVCEETSDEPSFYRIYEIELVWVGKDDEYLVELLDRLRDDNMKGIASTNPLHGGRGMLQAIVFSGDRYEIEGHVWVEQFAYTTYRGLGYLNVQFAVLDHPRA